MSPLGTQIDNNIRFLIKTCSVETKRLPRAGTLIWYYHVCKRQVWLMAHSLEPDQEHQFVALGRWMDQQTYKREHKRINIDNITIDILSRKEGNLMVGEVKKSSKHIESAKMQLAYYLLTLKRKGVNAEGVLLFPKEKKRVGIKLTPEIEKKLLKIEKEIWDIIKQGTPPSAKRIRFCSKCAYAEFCWA
ncbi:MAG: CRISPR-associated protein Cas4 [Chlorobi bacterium]|nr:CRISPR-associated protein Cas4 [Chlorobiota bacterium]